MIAEAPPTVRDELHVLFCFWYRITRNHREAIMKRRIGKNVATACVAGLMLGTVGAIAPDSAIADASTTAEVAAETASQNTNAALYGPPSVFEGTDQQIIDEPIQDLYGPPPIFEPIEVLYGPPPIDYPINDPVDEPIQLLYGPPSMLLDENPMKVRVFDKTIKAKRIASKKRVFKNAIVVKKAAGKVRYIRISKASSKRLKVNSANGAITLAKGTKKGEYAIKVKVRASGNDKYAPKAKTVTVKVRVK